MTVQRNFHNQCQEKTAESFTKDGWWKTGDLAIIENGVTRSVKIQPSTRPEARYWSVLNQFWTCSDSKPGPRANVSYLIKRSEMAMTTNKLFGIII